MQQAFNKLPNEKIFQYSKLGGLKIALERYPGCEAGHRLVGLPNGSTANDKNFALLAKSYIITHPKRFELSTIDTQNYEKANDQLKSIYPGIETLTDVNFIKYVAPLIAQAYRTSPDSNFRFFKQDYFVSGVAHYLDSRLSELDAAKEMRNEINASQNLIDDKADLANKSTDVEEPTAQSTGICAIM